MIAANWVPELVDYAGGVSLLSKSGKHSEYLSLDELAASEPEVIAIMPCGFDIDRSLREMKSLTFSPQWNNLPAVQNGRVYVTDGNQYFNRPGPRVVESAEILSECLYPGCFDFGHRANWMDPLASRLKPRPERLHFCRIASALRPQSLSGVLYHGEASRLSRKKPFSRSSSTVLSAFP